jgi:hypothetical protein
MKADLGFKRKPDVEQYRRQMRWHCLHAGRQRKLSGDHFSRRSVELILVGLGEGRCDGDVRDFFFGFARGFQTYFLIRIA